MRIENPKMIEITDNYIIGLPSRERDPAFIELVAVSGNASLGRVCHQVPISTERAQRYIRL